MGCGASVATSQQSGDANQTFSKKTLPPLRTDPSKVPAKRPNFEAFEVPIANKPAFDMNKDIETILQKPLLPQRLQRLAPLENAPQLTAEQLEEKMRKAEDKRMQALESRKSIGRRATARRAEVLLAREMTMVIDGHQDVEDKQNAAEKLREAKLAGVRERERLREERAQRVREKAKKLKESGIDDLNYELEHFGKEDKADSDVDSWTEETELRHPNQRPKQPIDILPVQTSGPREITSAGLRPLSSGYNSREASASTTSTTIDFVTATISAAPPPSKVALATTGGRLPRSLGNEDIDDEFFS